jgi:hypothetical protein
MIVHKNTISVSFQNLHLDLISASDLKDEVYITAFIDALLVAYTNETFTRFSRPQVRE